MTDAALTIGIDLGGTKMAAALVTSAGEVKAHRIVDRPVDATAMLIEPLELADSMITDQVVAVGVGAAGFVAEGVMVWGPNLSGTEIDFGQMFGQALGLPVAVDNDANLAALAETRLGAASGLRHVLMITVGTGIGGGWMIDGRRYHGRGFAGEVGHMVVDANGPVCTCGQNGCWESLASGRALDVLARDLATTDPDGMVAKLAEGDVATGRHLTDAALSGDLEATRALEEMADWLGMGIANLVAAFDPEIVVVGGGVSRAGDLLLEPARRAFRRSLVGAEHRPATPIVRAALGERAGVIGAGLAAWEVC